MIDIINKNYADIIDIKQTLITDDLILLIVNNTTFEFEIDYNYNEILDLLVNAKIEQATELVKSLINKVISKSKYNELLDLGI